MKFRFTAFLLLIALFYTPGLFSQEDVNPEEESNPLFPRPTKSVFNIGPTIGFNKVNHTVHLASFAKDPICPNFDFGSANGFFVGINTEIFPFGYTRPSHSFIVRVLYNTFPANFEVQTNDYYPSLIDTNPPLQQYDTIWTNTTNVLQVTYSVITVEVQYKWNPFQGRGFGIIIGPTFDYALKKTLLQEYKLIGPPEAKFDSVPGVEYTDNGRTAIVKKGDIENSSSFRFAIKLGAQYEVNLPGLGEIVPYVCYNFGVTKLSSAENWRVHAYQFGVDVRFQVRWPFWPFKLFF